MAEEGSGLVKTLQRQPLLTLTLQRTNCLLLLMTPENLTTATNRHIESSSLINSRFIIHSAMANILHDFQLQIVLETGHLRVFQTSTSLRAHQTTRPGWIPATRNQSASVVSQQRNVSLQSINLRHSQKQDSTIQDLQCTFYSRRRVLSAFQLRSG